MKVLVANRGEIAIRILRACREAGLQSVAVYTDVDSLCLHPRYADESVAIGDRLNYLDIPTIIEAARKTGAEAIHPGYGFLAENPAFARAVEDAGITFIGPTSETVALMGDKLAARRFVQQLDIPVIPGTDYPLPEMIPAGIARQVHYPVLVKASAGGGGRGIRLALTPEELPQVVEAARQEARAAFGDDKVFLESLVKPARHVEVQILGDGRGRVVCLGERECSIQRRRQKLIEEAPAPGLPESLRQQLYSAAIDLGKAMRYRSLGTVEFLLDTRQKFYFIEVNPRIQVEHPVTEMSTGLDLVNAQLELAAGEPLRLRQEDIVSKGAAIEARILAEDTQQGFLPSTGQVAYLKEPGGPGIRVDSALYQGMTVGAEYDSLLSKVIAWGSDRATAIQRLRRALMEYQVGGVSTDIEFILQIINSAAFTTGEVSTTYLESFQPEEDGQGVELEREIAVAAALYAHQKRSQPQEVQLAGQSSRWQWTAWQEQMGRFI